MAYRGKLLPAREAGVGCGWGMAEDVLINLFTDEGDLIALQMTAADAKRFANRIFQAALAAEELDQSYYEYCQEDAERDQGLTLDGIEPFLF